MKPPPSTSSVTIFVRQHCGKWERISPKCIPPILEKDYIPGGCLGCLNHQQFYSPGSIKSIKSDQEPIFTAMNECFHRHPGEHRQTEVRCHDWTPKTYRCKTPNLRTYVWMSRDKPLQGSPFTMDLPHK